MDTTTESSHTIHYVICIFGGCKKLAALVGLRREAVWKWKRRGRIPQRWHRQILTIAIERGLDLSAEDLVLGRAA